MGLVELILGRRPRRDAARAVAIDVMKIRKTPIVVNDSRGFYTLALLPAPMSPKVQECGQKSPPLVDNVGHMTGMPAARELADDVALDLAYKGARADQEGSQRRLWPGPSDALIEDAGRQTRYFGRKERQGYRLSGEQGTEDAVAHGRSRSGDRSRNQRHGGSGELKKRFLYQAVEGGARVAGASNHRCGGDVRGHSRLGLCPGTGSSPISRSTRSGWRS